MREKQISVEYFLLDPNFKKWVLFADAESHAYWEDYIQNNPSHLPKMEKARLLLINMSTNFEEIPDELLADTWVNIEKNIKTKSSISTSRDTTTVASDFKTPNYFIRSISYFKPNSWHKTAAAVILILSIPFLAKIWFSPNSENNIITEVIYEEFYASPGERPVLTLSDGTTVVLNSGSKIRHIKDFEKNERRVELTGEAFFDVAKDLERPFVVKTNEILTKALGTSFNINSDYKNSTVIQLFTGIVQINLINGEKIQLEPGNKIKIIGEKQELEFETVNPELELAWTNEIIILENTPIEEVTNILEKWFAVKIHFANSPPSNMELSGRFVNQSLENVLEGLSYSANFEFKLNENKVDLYFNK
jgi:ferric-dicitrate binding protein FerR (iron transport regulator)